MKGGEGEEEEVSEERQNDWVRGKEGKRGAKEREEARGEGMGEGRRRRKEWEGVDRHSRELAKLL